MFVIVPNRKSETLHDIFENKIKKATLIITDGYSSYPKAVESFGSQHIIINHSDGFKNANGFTTNSIENVWSHLKKYIEKAGLLKGRIESSLKEFVWKKIYIIYTKRQF
ncbi:hypothetical protein H311_02823 [Anncaliia algerae PRA109]|nr:hypothetical protein H311_02823 [Anncaliia algerae PRA109]